jgi:acyl-CoA dehydrogenase
MVEKEEETGEKEKLIFDFLDNIEFISPLLKGFPKYVEEIESIREKAREFIRENKERIEEAEKRAEENPYFFDWSIVKKGGKRGFLSLIIPKEFGGGGVKSLPYSFFEEELCAESAGIGNIFGAHALGLTPILLSPYIFSFSHIINEVVENEKESPILFAFALTEPTGGSDVQQNEDWLKKAKILTVAKKVKGGYILNGRKVFISNGSVAKYLTVFAVQDRQNPNFICLLVENNSKIVCRVENKMGQKTAHAAELVFEDIFVPDDMVVLKEGEGSFVDRVILSLTRAPVGAIATGIAKGAIKKTLETLSSTENGDIENEFVADRISEAISKLQMARGLWISSCFLQDQGGGAMKINDIIPVKVLALIFSQTSKRWENLTKKLGRKLGERLKDLLFNYFAKNLKKLESFSSIAKFSATQLSFEVCRICMETLGELGPDKSKKVERFLRDVRLTQIYETTNEVNKIILYRNLLGAKKI